MTEQAFNKYREEFIEKIIEMKEDIDRYGYSKGFEIESWSDEEDNPIYRNELVFTESEKILYFCQEINDGSNYSGGSVIGTVEWFMNTDEREILSVIDSSYFYNVTEDEVA